MVFELPVLISNAEFFGRIGELSQAGYGPLCLFGCEDHKLWCFMGKPRMVELLCTDFPASGSYPSLTTFYPAFSIYERELYEEYGIIPEGHPWLKGVRFPQPGSMKLYDFLSSESSALHEVGVGPVHAGVIEPGHFRFICRGEIIEHLEIQLGYQHRGLIKQLQDGDIRDKIHLAESIAGDTAIGHGLAYCHAVEELTGIEAVQEPVRQIALELERIAMHLADLSALCGDIAYIMGQNMFAALRTTVINTSLSICGSRFGKRWLTPGGVNYGINALQVKELAATLHAIAPQIEDCAAAMFSDTSVLSRLDDTGKISLKQAMELGFTGITARASGLPGDMRCDFAGTENDDFVCLTHPAGDVYARSWLRWQEIAQSLRRIHSFLEQIATQDELYTSPGKPLENRIVLSLVEGWRGRILHAVKTDVEGKTDWYRVYDPSFVNWQALALAVRGEGISDFPLCNKSFNLSYCGSDL